MSGSGQYNVYMIRAQMFDDANWSNYKMQMLHMNPGNCDYAVWRSKSDGAGGYKGASATAIKVYVAEHDLTSCDGYVFVTGYMIEPNGDWYMTLWELKPTNTQCHPYTHDAGYTVDSSLDLYAAYWYK